MLRFPVKGKAVQTSAVCLILGLAANLYGKGMGELKPQSDDAGKEDPEAVEEQQAEQVKPEPKPVEPAKVEPSAASLALADKLYLGTGLAIVFATPPSGTLATRGAADITAGYMIPTKIMDGMDLFGTFRYLPISGSAVVNNQSYRASFEAYNFGALGKLPLADGPTILGSFEIGYVIASAESMDGLGLDSDVAENGVSVTVGGGADWILLPKFALGPRLYLGFGRLQVIELSGAASFIF